jgi:hypothetical protein
MDRCQRVWRKAKHVLGRRWKKGDQNPWVAYTESLVQAILTNEKSRLDRVALAQKLKALPEGQDTL